MLSAGTNGGGQISDNLDCSQAILSSPSPTAKKPSYLNLACSISGYGGITTYDSKLREGFRSRDHSPGKLIGIQNGSREASPARVLGATSTTSGNLLAAPSSGRLSWTPSPVGGLISTNNDMKHISPTIGGGQRFIGTNGTDQTDTTGNFKRISDQRNRWLESTLSPSEKNKDYQQVVTVFESKSGNHGVTTETAVETRYEVNSRSQSTVVSSKTVISSNSHPQQYSASSRAERIIPIAIEGDSPPDRNGKLSYTNGSALHHTPVSSKSFIQQRVERLYGPGALAQGFFHRSVKSSFSTSLNSPGANGVSCQLKVEERSSSENSENSHELPVLRHLRPEFREQLTVAPRRSFGPRVSNGSSPIASKLSSPGAQNEIASNTLQMQQKASSKSLSLADLQPAAPEVVLPQQSPSVSSMTNVDVTGIDKEESVTTDPAKVSACQESKPNRKIHEDDPPASMPAVSPEEPRTDETVENAGHKFLRIQRQTIEKVLELAQKAEQEIEEDMSSGKPILSEEALGHLRAAAGQARLLVTQKMVQFEGLCHKCINQHPDEPFPTTAEDLQGFWDMLLLQVDQVHNTFQHLEKLKAVGWCEEKLAKKDQLKSTDSSATRTPNSASKRTSRTTKTSSTSAAKSAEAAALRKQREEERRKLMEQRRKELKQKQQSGENSSVSNETVEIFGAQPS